MTVADLVDNLGVTTTAVRQHVNRLLAEGWLVRTRRRGGQGRPADVFTTSEQAKRLFAGWSDEFSKLLIEEIAEVEGPVRSREILQAVGRRMAEQGRRFVGEGPPVERLRRLADLLSQEGVLAETNGSPDDLRLRVFACPYRGVAHEHREVCEMERETFSELVGGAVQRHQCMLDGHERCEFSLSSQAVTDAGS
jgi:predicted ArsR family transcriptional regulator